MAGIRTASVWTIGAATLATTIGQRSLGDPIFAGLQTQNWALVLAGCIASAGLALVADSLLGLIERGFAQRRNVLSATGAVLAGLGIFAAGLSLVGTGDGQDRIVIGAKGFSEQYILARAIGMTLEEAGYSVEYRDGLGSAVVHSALTSGEIDISIDYTGTLWTNQLKRADNPGRRAMYDEIVRWEADTSGAKVLGRLGFENAYGFAMRRDQARFYQIGTIADLAPVTPQLTMGGDPEWFERPEWQAVRDAYGLRFGEQRTFSPTFMYNALQSGEADVIGAYTSDGRIAADDLVVLEDPEGALPNYDAIVLLTSARGDDARLAAALEPLIGAVDVDTMRQANYAVDREEDKWSVREAARWLLDEVR